jgi:general nucleoside transport system permease protein
MSGVSSVDAPLTMPIPPPRRLLPGWARGGLAALAALAVPVVSSFSTGEHELTSSGTAQAALRLMLPILLAGLGGLWAERAGVINLGLEGMLILGTWGGAFAGLAWGPWAGVLGGVLFGALGGLLHAVATVSFGVNHIVSGVAITLLAGGLTKYLATLIFQPTSHNLRQSAPLTGFDTYSIQPVSGWLAAVENGHVPVVADLAGLLRGLITGFTPLVVLGLLLVPISYYLLWRTRFGLRLRSCGENPFAAESLGVSVYTHKYAALVVSGALAGLGGVALVLNPGQLGYLEGQTGGRGYIGLAAMIFGNWRPGGLLAGAALFGYVDGLQLRAGGEAVHSLLYGASLLAVVVAVWWAARALLGPSGRVRRWWLPPALALAAAIVAYTVYYLTDTVPREFASYAPQLVTLVVLAVAAQRLSPPAADGLEYRRGTGD